MHLCERKVWKEAMQKKLKYDFTLAPEASVGLPSRGRGWHNKAWWPARRWCSSHRSGSQPCCWRKFGDYDRDYDEEIYLVGTACKSEEILQSKPRYADWLNQRKLWVVQRLPCWILIKLKTIFHGKKQLTSEVGVLEGVHSVQAHPNCWDHHEHHAGQKLLPCLQKAYSTWCKTSILLPARCPAFRSGPKGISDAGPTFASLKMWIFSFYINAWKSSLFQRGVKAHSWFAEPPNAKVLDIVQDQLARLYIKKHKKLDSVGSTVRYEMMKLCTGSV